MIIPLFKPLGASTHLLAAAVGAARNEKATHTGTLDPMADGVVVVLTGADRFSKEKYTNWEKTYRFQMLFGIATDSHDLLGLTTAVQVPKLSPEVLQQTLNLKLPLFTGPHNQMLPDFSAKRIDGESSFDKAKRGEEITPTTQAVVIHSLQLHAVQRLPLEEVHSEITVKIAQVTGDFRQDEILLNWQKTFSELRSSNYSSLLVAELEARTSKRTYIRALVRDIAASLEIPATTYSITRLQNGPYTVEDCVTF